MKTILPSEVSVGQLHQVLLGAVAPRPIAFASTIDAAGHPNLAPFSFFNVFSANPPILIFSPARRGRDNTTKHTFENVKEVKECVIHIVNFDMVQQMSLSSVEFPKGVSEFVKAGFTPLPSEHVKPFRVKEAPIQIECKVNEVIELGQQGGAGNLVICEVLCIHLDEKILDTNGRIDPRLLDPVARLGGDWYTRASAGLFEVPKPNEKPAIGFDQLPADILQSPVLSGNDLGQLGNVEKLPDETSVNEYKLTELAELFMDYEGKAAELELALHQRAKELLAERKTQEAWMTLLSFNNR
jgi:flavin reductase (DIM6/NTAB) family NADH-FMN oxidoreductase RutF